MVSSSINLHNIYVYIPFSSERFQDSTLSRYIVKMNPIYLLLAFVSLSFAGTVLDMSLAGVDIAQPNSIPNSKVSARAFPNVRRNLGQEACYGDLQTTAGRNRQPRVIRQTRLVSAVCNNDIDYTARCQTVIPQGNNDVLTHDEKCYDNEVCSQISYRNFLGGSTSEVVCTEKDTRKHEFEWSTDSLSIGDNHCGPGLNVIHEEDRLTISVQFYGGSNGAGRNWVQSAWIQSNKRSARIRDLQGVNGLFWEGPTHVGESIQACFKRDRFSDATRAVLDWVDG